MDMVKMWGAIEAMATEVAPNELKAIVCNLIDYTAARNGVSSMELLAEIEPIIRFVNNELGAVIL